MVTGFKLTLREGVKIVVIRERQALVCEYQDDRLPGSTLLMFAWTFRNSAIDILFDRHRLRWTLESDALCRGISRLE